MGQRRQGWWNGRVERGEETEAEAQSREGQREGQIGTGGVHLD